MILKDYAMRRIECSPFRDEDGQINLEQRIRGTLQHGLSWYGEMQSIDTAFRKLDKSLGKEHVALTSVVIPGSPISVPLLLLSPQGVRTFLPSPIQGVFRAKGDEWLKFGGGTSRRFTEAKPNLQWKALEMAQTTLDYLRARGFGLPEIEAVLIFTNPRTHVESSNSPARIVLADAIERFASNLLQFQPIMDREDIRDLVQVITHPEEVQEERPIEPAQPAPRPRPSKPIDLPDAARVDSEALIHGEAAALSPRQQRALSGIKPRRFPFTRKQWILLGLMFILDILVIGIFAALVLSDSVY
jgi:hypothetical protein